MSKNLKVLSMFLLNLLNSSLIFCKSSIDNYFNDVSISSQALHDIVDEFLLKESIKFNILVFDQTFQLDLDVLSDFMAKSNGKFACKVQFYDTNSPTRSILVQSNILSMTSFNDFDYIGEFFQIHRYQNQPIKYFVLTSTLTFYDLENSDIYSYFNEISVFSNEPFFYAYFITNEVDTVTLSTIEWFSPQGCSRPSLNRLNIFDKKSMKWSSKLENYEKFLGYHGCELVMLLPIPLSDGTVQDVCGFSIINKNSTDFVIRGLSPIIFDAASKYFNFFPAYQPTNISFWWFHSPGRFPIGMIKINGTRKIPHVFLKVTSLDSVTHPFVRLSNVVANLNFRMVYTLPEKYTPYEKFILPFDLETWILLALTFMLTFLSIFIINRFSKRTRNIIYGNEVNTPFWNVLSIFFGISQTKLPNKNFSRFILIIFIYFCLIFRTCFQSKFFEFMTSEPRQEPPKTIKDLILRKYNVFSIKQTDYYMQLAMRIGEWPDIYGIDILKFRELFLTQSKNSSAKTALCLDEFFQNFIEHEQQRNLDWGQLKDTILYTTSEAFQFWGHSFYFRMFKILIDSLIPTGIMKHLVEKHYTKTWKFEKPEEGPKVLEVDDLRFGFNIWLECCVISTLAFVAELAVRFHKTRKLKQKVKLMKIHPMKITSLKNQPNFVEVKSELVEKFRIKKQEVLNVDSEIITKENEELTDQETLTLNQNSTLRPSCSQ